MSRHQSDFWQFNNLVSIITSVVIITIAFGALMTRVAVLESELNSVNKTLDQILAFEQSTQKSTAFTTSKIDTLDTRVSVLESILAVK